MSSRRPTAASCSGPSWTWVVEAGWITSVLASPTLARCEASRQPSMNRAPAARPPLTPKLTIEPAPLGSRRAASAWSGCSGRLGWTTQATAGWAGRKSSTAAVLAMWRSMRKGRVSMPSRR